MADTKTTAEAAATTLGGTELVRGVQSAANVKITIDQIKTWCSASPTLVTPDLGVATATSVSSTSFYGGGTTNSFPWWKRNGAVWDAMLADNSGYTSLNVGALTAYLGSVTTYSGLVVANSVQITSAGANGLFLFQNASAANAVTFELTATNSFRQGFPAADVTAVQTFTLGDAAVGTNITNAGSVFRSGLATGNAAVAPLKFQVGVIQASGTTIHTYASAISINNSTATGLQFNGYGAGAITSDGSGNLTAASDPRMKNIQRKFTDGLDALSKIKPVVYRWKPDSGMDSENDYAGFDAQNVRDAVELATWKANDGTLSLQDRALLAACVNSINQIARHVGLV